LKKVTKNFSQDIMPLVEIRTLELRNTAFVWGDWRI
jgi:hypothetical protein